MKLHLDFGQLETAGSVLRESGFEIERIRIEAEKQLTELLQLWQGEDSQALMAQFYASGGLNEFSIRLKEGHLDFYRHVYEAALAYEKLARSIAESEQIASRKT